MYEGKNGTLFDPLDKASLLHALSYFHSVDLRDLGRESVRIEAEYNPQNTASNISKAIEAIVRI